VTDASVDRLKTARAIREVIQRYLQTSSAEARSQLPADWAPLLPLEVGAAEVSADGEVRVGVWRLDLRGGHARLDYEPPGAITTHHRLGFRIELRRENGEWAVVPPGVSLVHAWARQR
jgi:hypothetical protein